WRTGRPGGHGCAGGRGLLRRSLRSARIPGRPRDLLSRIARRRKPGADRQLPARAAALLRQPAGFLPPPRRGRSRALFRRLLLHRAGWTRLHFETRAAAGAAPFRGLVSAIAISAR